MKFVFSAFVALATLGLVSAVTTMYDTINYPACLEDNDCRKDDGHACFQYFCYPWQAHKASKEDPLPLGLCRMDKDCGVTDGVRQKCFKHHDKRKITSGICISTVDQCSSHAECQDLGGYCCNSFCCNEVYFEAIQNLPCVSDEGCQV